MVDQHVKGLGSLLANLISLETALRAYLGNSGKIPSQGTNLSSLKVGDKVPVDAFTSYHQLSELIDLYNDYVRTIDTGLLVDRSVVDLRHSIAHGRALSAKQQLPLTLYKFSAPTGSPMKVEVTHCLEMSDCWFHDKIKLVYSEIKKVLKADAQLPS